jgi:hypothetical protein
MADPRFPYFGNAPIFPTAQAPAAPPPAPAEPSYWQRAYEMLGGTGPIHNGFVDTPTGPLSFRPSGGVLAPSSFKDQMSDNVPGASAPAVSAPVISGADTISLSDAARSLAEFRWKRDNPEAPPAETTETPERVTTAPEEPPAVEAEETSTPETASTGTEETPEAPSEPAEPVIDPPRSWDKSAREKWATLPRDTQEYLAQRESERDKGLHQSQQKVADERKAIAAERQAAESARQQYEAQLPALMTALQDANAQHFGDIRSVDDVTNLAAQDPFRYLQWQAHQSKLAAVKAEQDAADRRNAEEKQTSFARYVNDESEKFNAALNDADKAKLKDYKDQAPKFLSDRGFSEQELNDLWNDKQRLSIHDYRVQNLILDGLKYRGVQAAKAAVVAKPLPPAVRPGSQAPASGNAAKIAALTKQLDNATGMQAIRLASQLTQLRRKG